MATVNEVVEGVGSGGLVVALLELAKADVIDDEERGSSPGAEAFGVGLGDPIALALRPTLRGDIKPHLRSRLWAEDAAVLANSRPFGPSRLGHAGGAPPTAPPRSRSRSSRRPDPRPVHRRPPPRRDRAQARSPARLDACEPRIPRRNAAPRAAVARREPHPPRVAWVTLRPRSTAGKGSAARPWPPRLLGPGRWTATSSGAPPNPPRTRSRSTARSRSVPAP